MTAEDDIGDILDEIDRNLNGDKQKKGMNYRLWADQSSAPNSQVA